VNCRGRLTARADLETVLRSTAFRTARLTRVRRGPMRLGTSILCRGGDPLGGRRYPFCDRNAVFHLRLNCDARNGCANTGNQCMPTLNIKDWMTPTKPIAGAEQLVILTERRGTRAAVRAAIEETVRDHFAGLDILARIGNYKTALQFIRNNRTRIRPLTLLNAITSDMQHQHAAIPRLFRTRARNVRERYSGVCGCVTMLISN
jgi:hypothetical protein